MKLALAGQNQKTGLVAIILATVFVLALNSIDDVLLSRYFSSTTALVIQVLIAVLGVAVFTWGMLLILGSVQQRLSRRSAELEALHTAGLAVNLDLKADIVLQRVANEAGRLTGARYAALLTTGSDDKPGVFYTSGIDHETERRIGHRPVGRGVLGLALQEGQTFVLDDISSHPASIGFPEHHPPMQTLLTVPVRAGDEILGQLYLSDKHDGQPFDTEDRQTVERFAALAALAIKNARQLERIEALAIVAERNRVAREMHDNVAQVLGYVSTKSQATSELIRSGRHDRAVEYLNQIQEVTGEAFDDVRDQIVALRMDASDEPLETALSSFVSHWSQRTGIPATLAVNLDQCDLKPESRLHALRVVQEALMNVDRHAGASCASVNAAIDGDTMVIEVQDDGVGIPGNTTCRHSSPQFGIAIMHERAQAMDGDLEITPCEPGGTLVRLKVPIGRTVAGTGPV